MFLLSGGPELGISGFMSDEVIFKVDLRLLQPGLNSGNTVSLICLAPKHHQPLGLTDVSLRLTAPLRDHGFASECLMAIASAILRLTAPLRDHGFHPQLANSLHLRRHLRSAASGAPHNAISRT